MKITNARKNVVRLLGVLLFCGASLLIALCPVCEGLSQSITHPGNNLNAWCTMEQFSPEIRKCYTYFEGGSEFACNIDSWVSEIVKTTSQSCFPVTSLEDCLDEDYNFTSEIIIRNNQCYHDDTDCPNNG